MAVLVDRPTIATVLQRAHAQAFAPMRDDELARYLADVLGRPIVARLAGTPDVNTVTRWAMGRTKPGELRVERMHHAAYVFHALIGLGLSETNARQWFRGANPTLGDQTPMDVIKQGDYQQVIAAVRTHASS